MSKILVIDDEAWLCEMIRLALMQQGHEVSEAGDGEEGIAKARADVKIERFNMDGFGFQQIGLH